MPFGKLLTWELGPWADFNELPAVVAGYVLVAASAPTSSPKTFAAPLNFVASPSCAAACFRAALPA